VDSPSVTGLRTAATTAVAIRHLAQDGARAATIIGCGALGRFHLEALAACGVQRVSLCDRVATRAQGLAEWGRSSGMQCLAVADARAATLASEIVVTCTTSRIALLGCDDIRPGTLVAAVGADNENKAEIAPQLIARARIVADLASQCAKIGDLRNAAPGEAHVCGELADAVAGRIARVGPDEIVLFDSTGLALEDLAVGALLADSPALSRRAAPA
jgi:ornithine cyclodeaminase/alanine dehydrogenase-like protein (mu-crystallin family)